jgi:hypothetical protein
VGGGREGVCGREGVSGKGVDRSGCLIEEGGWVWLIVRLLSGRFWNILFVALRASADLEKDIIGGYECI